MKWTRRELGPHRDGGDGHRVRGKPGPDSNHEGETINLDISNSTGHMVGVPTRVLFLKPCTSLFTGADECQTTFPSAPLSPFTGVSPLDRGTPDFSPSNKTRTSVRVP